MLHTPSNLNISSYENRKPITYTTQKYDIFQRRIILNNLKMICDIKLAPDPDYSRYITPCTRYLKTIHEELPNIYEDVLHALMQF